MRTKGVPVLPPLLDDLPGFREIREQVGVQALVPESPVETFDEAIVRRLAPAGELQAYSLRVRPPA